MADNYIERKMEDLRAGKLNVGSAARPFGKGKNYVSFPMPQRRVLIIEGSSQPARTIAGYFVKAGCKVAILDQESETGTFMAKNEGVRLIPVSADIHSSIIVSFENLYAAWRGVDIVVSSSEYAHRCAEIWRKFKETSPLLSDFRGRLIILSNIIKPSLSDLSGYLKGLNISVNLILCPLKEFSYKVAADAAIFLSLPETHLINNSVINLTEPE